MHCSIGLTIAGKLVFPNKDMKNKAKCFHGINNYKLSVLMSPNCVAQIQLLGFHASAGKILIKLPNRRHDTRRDDIQDNDTA